MRQALREVFHECGSLIRNMVTIWLGLRPKLPPVYVEVREPSLLIVYSLQASNRIFGSPCEGQEESRLLFVRKYVVPHNMNRLMNSGSGDEFEITRPMFPILVTYFNLAWIKRLHSAGLEMDYNLCNLSHFLRLVLDYCTGPLGNRERHIYSTRTGGDQSDLALIIDHFLNMTEISFGDNFRSFSEFVNTRDETIVARSSVSTSCPPSIVDTCEEQDLVDEIFICHCLKQAVDLHLIHCIFEKYNIREPWLISRISSVAFKSANDAILSRELLNVLYEMGIHSFVPTANMCITGRRELILFLVLLRGRVLDIDNPATKRLIMNIAIRKDLFHPELMNNLQALVESRMRAEQGFITRFRATLRWKRMVQPLSSIDIYRIKSSF